MLIFKVLPLILAVHLAHADISYPKDHCVAWKTKKTMFLFKKLEPVGVSCDVKTVIKKDNKGDSFLKIEVPIKSFDSNESKRDAEVVKILKADKQANLVFTTYEALKIYNSKNNFKGKISGEISIGGKKSPIEFKVSKTRQGGESVYLGKAVLKYTDLGISPPSVAGGVVAKVADYLELHFKFSEDKINKSL